MSKLTLNSILFNAAGIGLLVTTVGYMGYSFLVTQKVARCTKRYPPGTQFSLAGETGKALTPIELQGRGGADEWGILKNAKVVSGADGGSEKILEVSLARTENEDQVDQNGIGFVWPVDELSQASSACLSYKVRFPKDFHFTEPGYLPGFFGIGPAAKEADENGEGTPAEGFQVRMGWAAKGDVGTEIRSPISAGTWVVSGWTRTWPIDQWVDVEQEVVLNNPGAKNGLVRIWIDGQLIVDMHEAYYRGSPISRFGGILSEVGYARTASDVKTLRLSPFVVSRQ